MSYHTRQNLFEDQDGKCHYCGTQMINGRLFPGQSIPDHHCTIEHLLPVSEGGTYHRENLVAACRLCNNQRGKMPYHTFRWIRSSPNWKIHLKKWKRDDALHKEMSNRVRKVQTYVYV